MYLHRFGISVSSPRALEQARVHSVEAHERRKQPPVAFHGLVAEQEAAAGKALLDLIECFEELAMRALVRDLRSGRADAVDPIVDALRDPLVERVDLGAQAAPDRA